jgi:hypothetical protein
MVMTAVTVAVVAAVGVRMRVAVAAVVVAVRLMDAGLLGHGGRTFRGQRPGCWTRHGYTPIMCT